MGTFKRRDAPCGRPLSVSFLDGKHRRSKSASEQKKFHGILSKSYYIQRVLNRYYRKCWHQVVTEISLKILNYLVIKIPMFFFFISTKLVYLVINKIKAPL